MSLLREYRDAEALQELGRVRRLVALRALVAAGHTQREIASLLGVSSPAVCKQVRTSRGLREVDPEIVLKAARRIVIGVADRYGFARVGALPRDPAAPDRQGPGITLVLDCPEKPGARELEAVRSRLQEILGCPIAVLSYQGLKGGFDHELLAAIAWL